MKNPLIIQNSITIDAPASTVWDALTKPELTKKYMFGCETVSSWKVGSELLWKGMHEGKEVIFVKGNILDIVPNRRLVYTTIDPLSGIDDKSENYLAVTYELIEENGKTHFTVTQGDYAAVADGERRYRDSYNNGEGWNPILKEIKKLVETGK
ncbi:MAG TPA: SRPBCC domain-containing protein [Ohtaekwangia sp.]